MQTIELLLLIVLLLLTLPHVDSSFAGTTNCSSRPSFCNTAGHYCVNGKCQLTPKGFYSNANSGIAVACNTGYSTLNTGTAGTGTSGTINASPDVCRMCAPGFGGTTSTGSSGCTICNSGTYSVSSPSNPSGKGCYGAYTPNYNCYGYPSCGYTCVGNYCAYDGSSGCKCDCGTCSQYYPNLTLMPHKENVSL